MKSLLLSSYSALLRLLKPYAGLTRLSFNPLTRWLLADVAAPARTRMIDGTAIEVDPHDYHGRVLYLFGSNDFKVSKAVNVLLAPGDVLLDIGANYGTIGFLARHVIGPAGEVHLFEPQPHLADILEKAIAGAGEGARMHLHRVALFDRDDTLTMRRPSHHSGMATLIEQDQEGGFPVTFSVPTRETGAYVHDILHGRRFGVKIDIEGAEMQVLPGLAAQPNFAFCVFEGAHQKDTLYRFFTEHGFRVYGLKRHPLLFRMAPVETEAAMNAYHDFVAVRAEDVSAGEDAAAGRAVARYAA